MGKLGRLLYRVVWIVSGEFLLQWPERRANGGTIILVRSTLVSLIVYANAIILMELLDPAKEWRFSSVALRLAVKNTLPWFAAIFAGAYAVLYARFSSQWSYLASLYNLIKSTEAHANTHGEDAIVSMKVGFIEDADELHLALKQMYATLIKNWATDEKIRSEFATYAPGGEVRLNSLLADVNRVTSAYEEYQTRKSLKAAGKSTSD
jgi:predicted ABC-type exoprotein transport system permease subunit